MGLMVGMVMVNKWDFMHMQYTVVEPIEPWIEWIEKEEKERK